MSPLLDSEKSIENKVENSQPVVVESKNLIHFFFQANIINNLLYFKEKEINVILNHGAEDAECYGECAARMLVTHHNEKPQLSISQVNILIPLKVLKMVFLNIILIICFK